MEENEMSTLAIIIIILLYFAIGYLLSGVISRNSIFDEDHDRVMMTFIWPLAFTVFVIGYAFVTIIAWSESE
jgi:Na+/proline symporter